MYFSICSDSLDEIIGLSLNDNKHYDENELIIQREKWKKYKKQFFVMNDFQKVRFSNFFGYNYLFREHQAILKSNMNLFQIKVLLLLEYRRNVIMWINHSLMKMLKLL